MIENYRLMRRTHDGETVYGIHRVYYDDTGKITGWTENVLPPKGSSLENFYEELGIYLEALSLECLDFNRLERR